MKGREGQSTQGLASAPRIGGSRGHQCSLLVTRPGQQGAKGEGTSQLSPGESQKWWQVEPGADSSVKGREKDIKAFRWGWAGV